MAIYKVVARLHRSSSHQSYLSAEAITMTKSLKVAVVGATGTTGSAIIAGLLNSEETEFVSRVSHLA